MNGCLILFTGEVPPSAPSTPISRYADHLKSMYEVRTLPSYDKWPPTSSKRFMNLSIIPKEQASKKETDEFTEATVHGNIEAIVRKKKNIELCEVGKLDDGLYARCIIIQGAPGVGKTTLSWELCRQWAERKILKDYSLVVLIKLRDRGMQGIKHISELFYTPDTKLQGAVCEEVAQKKGESVLFLLDGFDEAPRELQQRSIFSDLIEGSLFPKATVIITTRPTGITSLHDKCRTQKLQHIEVLGFTAEQIREYTQDIMGNDENLLSDFRTYLEYNPHIHAMMYIPLNCAIVTEVYRSNKDKDLVPKTQTQLYTLLIKSLLHRYLSDHPKYRNQEWSLRALSDLPSDVYQQLLELSKLAYEGILAQKLIFPELPPNVATLGLMQAVPEIHSYGSTSYSYNFLHLTLQEYLAAFHVTQMPMSEQAKCIDTSFGEEHLVMVLRFVAGLTKFHYQPPETTSFLEKVTQFGKGLVKSRTPADCLRSFHHSCSSFIESLHWLFEAESKELLCKALPSHAKTGCSRQTLSPFDCYVLHYVITNSQCLWTLELGRCGIKEEGMRMLTGTVEGSFSRVVSLNLGNNTIGSAAVHLGEYISVRPG